MHGNQLVEVARLAEESGAQLVLSMLSDKLSGELDDERYVVLSLSQDEKLLLRGDSGLEAAMTGAELTFFSPWRLLLRP